MNNPGWADAIQWAIKELDKAIPRGERPQDERNELHALELMKQYLERNHRRAFERINK